MLKYGKNIIYNPDKLDLLNIDRQSVGLVPKESEVLDIGCATGFMGKYLKYEKKCKVTGIDIGREEAKEAFKALDSVIVGDIEETKTLNKIKNKFDIILASAIIEHLKNPDKALKIWKKFLKRDGFLVITTSNISHWSIRIKTLFGDFSYQEYGILDNTHLRFYNTKTFKELLVNAGYKIDYFSIDPVGGGFPRVSKFLSRFFPNLFAYQMLAKAKPLW